MDYELMRKRLVEAREFIGCNRKDFAESLGMPYRTITNYENGAREPGSDYLTKVADKCGCTTDWLLGLSNDPRSDARSARDAELLDEACRMLVQNFLALNQEGQERLLDYSDDLVKSGKYIKSHSSEVGEAAAN